VGAAVFSAENRPFGKYCQTVQGSGPGTADGGISQDPVVEGYIDAVVIPVKGHRLHIDICVQQFRTAYPGTGGCVQQCLGTLGQKDPQIFNAILIPAAVGDFSGVDGHSLPQILRITAQAALALIRHVHTSRYVLGISAMLIGQFMRPFTESAEKNEMYSGKVSAACRFFLNTPTKYDIIPLRGNKQIKGVQVMTSGKGLEWTFDTASSVYEKMRPGYVTALYQEILEYIPLDESCKAVEVGIGTGQATLPILKTGCEITAVECGESLAEKCRNKFRDYPNFSVKTRKFEDAILEKESYDLVFSATAFHWIPEEQGYQKVYSILKKGGAFARFANHPYPARIIRP